MILRSYLGVLTLLFVGCGNPCEREERIAERRCDIELAPEFETGEQICGPIDEKEARCAIANKAEFCDWLEGLQAGNVVENDYTRCLRE